MPVTITSLYSSNYKIDYLVENDLLSVKLLDINSNKPVAVKSLELIKPGNEVFRTAHNKSVLTTSVPLNVPVVKVKFDNYEKFMHYRILRID